MRKDRENESSKVYATREFLSLMKRNTFILARGGG
jgi:hypothetical protein